MGVQFRFCGEKARWPKGGSTAPLLARDRLTFGLLIDVTLELVECDHRSSVSSPSLLLLPVGSTATLFLRLWSCGMGSRPTLSAMIDVSVGLCTFIGTAEFRSPGLVELSEPVRFTVTTDVRESDLDLDEWRWRLERPEEMLAPLDVLSSEIEGVLPCTVCILTGQRQPYTCALCACARYSCLMRRR